MSKGVNRTKLIDNGRLGVVLNRTVFSNGSRDPWYATQMLRPTNKTGNFVINIDV